MFPIGKGSPTSTMSTGLMGKSAFPAPPVTPGMGGFANSPIGMRMFGKPDATTEIYGAKNPGFVDTLRQQVQYNKAQQDAMTPEQKRRQELLAMLGQQGQEKPQFSPVQFGAPQQGGGSLAQFVQALLARSRGGM